MDIVKLIAGCQDAKRDAKILGHNGAVDAIDSLTAAIREQAAEIESLRKQVETDKELSKLYTDTIATLRADLAEAKLAFEIYASFGGYHPNTGNGSSYYLQADGVEVENDGWSDSRTYPVGEKFDKLTIESVIKAAFVVRGKGGTFGDTFDSRLTARSAMQEGK